VFYELGVRHRLRPTGTVIARQENVRVPFDLNVIRTFTYSYESPSAAEQSRQRLTKLLQHTLEHDEPSIQPAGV
jgi:hypothetical protein